jgi:hypothetical protein
MFRGLLTMNERCPRCGLRFEREPGDYLGAMYFSYALSVPLLGLGMGLWYVLWPDLRFELIVLLGVVSYVPFIPLVYRYSRVLWLYFDRWVSPSSYNKLD